MEAIQKQLLANEGIRLKENGFFITNPGNGSPFELSANW
ncbi:hypothetical protein UF75_2457 [Desulfosporosinus sp. I2]|nr:hypothetical protein UF75_2457 [Desulfosporosinus sp. I2]